MPTALPVVVVIVSAVAYHLAQRALGAGPAASPWPVLALAYGAACVVTLVLALVTGDGLRVPARPERAAALVIAAGAIGIEAGFFFAYRAGWPLASASVLGNVVVTLILAGIGIVAFGEHLSAARAAGIALAAAGAYLIVRG